jgi:hypothetical protein
MSQNYPAICVGPRGYTFTHFASFLLHVEPEGVIVRDISEFDVTEEVCSLGFKVPLGEDLVNTVEISLSDVPATRIYSVLTV